MSKYVIYTDGAYSAKRNQGGVGIVILRDGQLLQKFNKGYKNTTNNRMELKAVIWALNNHENRIQNNEQRINNNEKDIKILVNEVQRLTNEIKELKGEKLNPIII